MKIYNIFFNANERNNNAGWGFTNGKNESLILTAKVGGQVKTVITGSDEVKASKFTAVEINNKDFKRKFALVPGYKTAKLVHSDGAPDYNFVVYIKAEEGKRIAAIKTDGCAVVMSNITGDKKEAALVVIVTDPDKFRVRAYQTDKQLMTLDKTGFKMSAVTHELKEARVIKPTLYLQLPEKVFFTKDLKSEKTLEQIAKGFAPVYVPLFLAKTRVLVLPKYENPNVAIDNECNDVFAAIIEQLGEFCDGAVSIAMI